jgi:hypothetical protein
MVQHSGREFYLDPFHNNSLFSRHYGYATFRLFMYSLQAGYVLEPDCNNRGNHIRDFGRHFYD